ncbi:Protein phosphatase 1 regulatory subunit 1C [Varanus komodoensis]|nr:Protein phosphatase 1 regulatory subunit 1C [Varanus komodoensis]
MGTAMSIAHDTRFVLAPHGSSQILRLPKGVLPITRGPSSEIEEKRTNNTSQDESQNASPKQRKQSVYTPPAMKGIKHLKKQKDSAFPEEEEGVSERDEKWSP